jgi:hypothetical protein
VSRAPDALRKLLRVMDGEDADDQITPSKAAIWVAERVYGKAPKEMHHSGDVSPAVQALLELAARSAEDDQRDGDDG